MVNRGKIMITPHANILIKHLGIKPEHIGKGSGEDGKVLIRDVNRYVNKLKKTNLYQNLTPKAFEYAIINNINPKKVKGMGKNKRVTKMDITKYKEKKDHWDTLNFLKRTGVRTAITLVLGYFLKIGTFPVTKHGSINKKALHELCYNEDYPKVASAACKISKLLDLGLNPRFLSILEQYPRLTNTKTLNTVKNVI
jgi:pyruvate/2-oxoglutarate dehydrogenase complex dihydrolipoamide acyltransferase (E2) component